MWLCSVLTDSITRKRWSKKCSWTKSYLAEWYQKVCLLQTTFHAICSLLLQYIFLACTWSKPQGLIHMFKANPHSETATVTCQNCLIILLKWDFPGLEWSFSLWSPFISGFYTFYLEPWIKNPIVTAANCTRMMGNIYIPILRLSLKFIWAPDVTIIEFPLVSQKLFLECLKILSGKKIKAFL